MKNMSQWLLAMLYLINLANCLPTNNICTFRTQGKLFSLIYLQTSTPYKLVKDNKTLYFNFCYAFVPSQCPGQPSAFSFLVTELPNQDPSSMNITKYKCERYSSNLTTSLFYTKFQQQQDKQDQQRDSTLSLTLLNQQATVSVPAENLKQTLFQIQCSSRTDFYVDELQIETQRLKISGNSLYGCPVFEVSSLWKVLTNNYIICGVIMFLVGFYLLFYGRSAIDITVFIAVFFVSLAAFGSLLTLFISPNSSTIVIYSSFLGLLFVSCLLGYMSTKLINVSVFFIGAFFGLILGILVSSIFSKLFNIYSQWPLILFILAFSIPLGLLTFKYHQEVIIASTAFTGAYLVIRPISWIIGGFPNQFLLYKAVEASQIKTLPGSFFAYLLAIIILAVIGAMYQKLKLKRQHPEQQIQINIIQQNLQAPIDAIKVQVDKLIQKFRPQKSNQDSSYQMLDENKGSNVNSNKNLSKQHF